MNLLSKLSLAVEVIDTTDIDGVRVGVQIAWRAESNRVGQSLSADLVLGDRIGDSIGVCSISSVASWKKSLSTSDLGVDSRMSGAVVS